IPESAAEIGRIACLCQAVCRTASPTNALRSALSRKQRPRVTLLHEYANPLKRVDISESVNLHKCLILLDSCRIHATRCRLARPVDCAVQVAPLPADPD